MVVGVGNPQALEAQARRNREGRRLRNQGARMSWILGCLALACFGWAATLALLIRAMEERDQARDMCALLMSRKK